MADNELDVRWLSKPDKQPTTLATYADLTRNGKCRPPPPQRGRPNEQRSSTTVNKSSGRVKQLLTEHGPVVDQVATRRRRACNRDA